MNNNAAKNKSLSVGESLIYACGEFGGNVANLVFGGWLLH